MPTDRTERVALLTGASRGIGLAIATALAQAGTRVWMVARSEQALRDAANTIGERAMPFTGDITRPADRDRLLHAIADAGDGLDVLVNNAGIIHLGRVAEASGDQFREQLDANVVAPYELTRACLPMLRQSCGEIIFINSSAGKSASPGVSQFSASQHAVRAFADALRAEVNADGIRVTVVHPGRTATTRQERIYETEARAYHPELLMQPEDVAMVVVAIVSLPRTAEITEISMRPMVKSY
jgi:NADP-dependent 3-hydroxy acid dehydrogenase YdfG